MAIPLALTLGTQELRKLHALDAQKDPKLAVALLTYATIVPQDQSSLLRSRSVYV